ncbi:metallophosphoesterase family protein [Nocardioides antri]|uniref:Metallophosphoesterase family protein n=1 Tax=Nocardioides antri TaxID=2607659 RepID=A0A5B1M436_9ACTN|nr:metallophosphoesterase [Nocardioides antri]KAA1427406.1 metallophosphoesterase family protein [Nocardioides antri]
MTRLRAWLPAAAYVVVWLVLSSLAAAGFFLTSERTVDVASHEARVTADFSGEVVVRTGPVLPDVRTDSGSPFGVQIELGKTDVRSLEDLTARYAAIGSNPDAQVDKVGDAVREMLIDSVARGLALGLVPLLVWRLLGEARRREIVDHLPTRRGVAFLLVVAMVVIGLTTPWRGDQRRQPERWTPLADFVGPEVDLPEELDDVEVLGPAGGGVQRLVASAIDSYGQGREFYADAAEAAAELPLRQPREGETVVLLLSDRHDNVGMDQVALAIAERGGAEAVFDAGDDTSTGEEWEAFSLDSLNEAFGDYDRWAVAGNHDHGSFVRSYLSDLGWTYFEDEVVDGPGGTRILGADDPRSSGLGNWRDESGLSFDEVRSRIADTACQADEDGERVDTLLVHDANLGDDALARGCVDLVVGGHTHVQAGPRPVAGDNGDLGYTYTVGTAGGAAYAIAIGTKLRRAAGLALITYRDGQVAGIQSVTLETTGRFEVDPYEELRY